MSPIERSAGGGGGAAAGGLVKLFESVLGATAASIDTGANGIPTGHSDLLLMCELQSNEAGPAQGGIIRFNGDAANNYDRQIGQANNAAFSAFANASASGMVLPLVNSTAAPTPGSTSVYGITWVVIPSYARTDRFKQAYGSGATLSVPGTAGTFFVNFSGGVWRSTAAINQVSVTCSTGGNVFAAGSRMTIFGLQ